MSPPSGPPSPPTEDDLRSLLTWRVIMAGRSWEHALTAVLAPHGLTPVQFGVLAQLSAHPTLTQAQLARRVMMRPQSMHHLLDTLVRRDLLERNADRGRGRPNPVSLTAAGSQLLRRVWPVVAEVNQPSNLGLDDGEAASLRAGIDTLMTRARGYAPGNG